ncbi:aminotransferase [Mycena rosella]|uniref:Branched-chain-amino-acid aminotransferase n=1 Tax=Mycena rosella TaxID=1033263 RepID=A0AAD7D8T3_MYCRO|nr:aminotransferase [Mycena rosella]
MASGAPHTNGNAHPIAPLDASRLKVQLAETLKPIPPQGSYGFGDIKTDHMLIMTYDPLTGWSAPEIKPYAPLSLDPASNCFQYCTNVFEGMKALLDPQGRPCMFRPKDNMARLVTSAARMALPPFDPEALLVCISKLVFIESRWIPSLPGHSLYIRPTMIGTKPSIKVGASDYATLYTIVTPVGPYFPTTSGGVSLLAVGEHVRSWPGGTGGFKLGLNYSPGFVPQRAAAALGYDQVLWLLGKEKLITEAGAMNFFAVVERADGGVDVVTPPLDGTILPGITRDAALVLLRAHAADPSKGILVLPADLKINVEERELSVRELAAWAKTGRLAECFGTGTAVLVVAIERIGDVADADPEALAEAANPDVKTPPVVDIEMKAGRGLGAVGTALWDKLLALKEGRDDFQGWSVLCE